MITQNYFKLFFLTASLLMGLTSTLEAASSSSIQLEVISSILPESFLIKQVGGDRVSVTTLIEGNESPVSSQASSQLLAKISMGDIFFRMGVPFEDAWIPRISSLNKKLKIIDLRQVLDGPSVDNPAVEDPHFWNDPLSAIKMGSLIQTKLSHSDPEGKQYYADRYQKLALDLRSLHQRITKKTSALKEKKFLVFHPAWHHFALRYGLKEIAIEKHGKSPGAHDLQELIKDSRRSGVRVVFVQDQFDVKTAKMLAKEIGAKVVRINPLAENYIENLDLFSDLLKTNLSN